MGKQHTSHEHFVPVMFLKNFADEKENTWVLRKSNKSVYPSYISKICYENDVYETKWNVENRSGEKYVSENVLEDKFWEMEDDISKDLREILYLVEKKKHISLEDKREKLVRFFTTLYLRNPDVLKEIMKIYEGVEKEEQLSMLVKLLGILLDKKGLGDKEAWTEQNVKMAIFDDTIENTPMRIEFGNLMKRTIVFWRSKEELFVTSSFPMIIDIDERKARDQIIIPISGKCACVLFNPNMPCLDDGMILDVPREFVERINEQFVRETSASNQIFISKNKEELERLKKLLD